VAPEASRTHRITRRRRLVVHGFRESPRGTGWPWWWGPWNPHVDNRPNEIYLADPAAGAMERLTDNDVGESIVGFSPDGSLLAIIRAP
jgi:hypothetical protein